MLGIVLNLADDTVLDVDDAVGAVGYAALVCYHYDGDALFTVQAAQQFQFSPTCGPKLFFI